MTLHPMGIILVVICALIESIAQLSLKKSTLPGSSKLRWTAMGLCIFAVEAILYTQALKSLDISIAYPLGALCFIFVALLSHWFLSEPMSPHKIKGIGLIVIGCFLITVSP